MKMEKKEVTGWDFLSLALIAFGGLGMEVLYAYFLEPMIYGAGMGEWTTGQTLSHWTLTCLTWGAFGWYVIRTAKKDCGFDLLEAGKNVRAWQWAVIFAAVLLTLGMSYASWDGFKVILEFQRNGAPKFVFQYIYYLFETLLFSLIIILGQKAFETWFHRKNIPYGGILCGLTWGLAHIFTKGSIATGLGGLLLGFLMGSAYLLVNRDSRKAYLVLCLMFIL